MLNIFYKCDGLTSVEINCKNVSSWFRKLKNITTIKLGEDVQVIGDNAFNSCTNVKTIDIGSSVTSIGSRAFGSIDKLTDVTCRAVAIPETDRTAFENSYVEYVNLHVPGTSQTSYKTTAPWSGFKSIEKIAMPEFTLTYMVDGEEYKTCKIEQGDAIIPETTPTKEGYSFSGWNELPDEMPGHDITVTGTFTINSYMLTYVVDGEEYKSFEVEYGSSIDAEAEPTKEGYTFSGWSELPETMPAKDLVVTGTFTINKYVLTYTVDGEEYKSFEVEFGSAITAEAVPAKEGYTFSGWSDIPETMPANDVTITGSFTVNSYTLTYKVDGEVYKTYDVAYGTAITPEAEPEKEGYTFSGWNEMPETMPANNVAVTGTFSINTYQVTYMIGGEVFKTDSIQYGATIVVPEATEREDYTFDGWADVPETMPAHDIVIYGSYTSGIIDVSINEKDVRIYDVKGRRIPKLQRGVNIIMTRDGRMRKVMVK